MGHLRVDLAEQLVAVANEDGGVHLPVLVEAAEVVAGLAPDHQLPVREPADHIQRLAQRQHDRVVPSHPLLQDREPLVEAIRVLVARLDVLHLAPRELLVEQRLERLALERLPTAFGGSTRATSEEARNSAADSAGVTFPGFTARSAGNVGVATPKLKSSGRSQKPRNSAAHRGESLIDSS